jgi:hypothetical protein|eukprot:COSAG06_NODE_3066_length_5900_cov_19.446241_6_plen_36_part_00
MRRIVLFCAKQGSVPCDDCKVRVAHDAFKNTYDYK